MKEYRVMRTWAELDAGNLSHNVSVLRGMLPDGCRLMAAVKANAYGHGALLAARRLQELGVGAFCVASLEEGMELREGGIEGEILILGYTHPSAAGALWHSDLTQTLVDADYARELSEACGERTGGREADPGKAGSRRIRAHLAIDTGMHRLGEWYGHTERIRSVLRLPGLCVTGLYTHLAAADLPGEEAARFAGEQAARLREVRAALRGRGGALPMHLLASEGLLHYPQLGGVYARTGLALYGVYGSAAERGEMEKPEGRDRLLRPVLSLRTRVTTVRRVPAGEGIGYGLCDASPRERTIAVLAAGYGDGIPRSLSCGGGEVLIRGRRARVAGRICMDQMMADVTGIPGVQSGETATLIGRDGEERITAEELAERAGTIPNEILARIGRRPERFWADGG